MGQPAHQAPTRQVQPAPPRVHEPRGGLRGAHEEFGFRDAAGGGARVPRKVRSERRVGDQAREVSVGGAKVPPGVRRARVEAAAHHAPGRTHEPPGPGDHRGPRDGVEQL